jgi:hypothetical protein
LPNDCDYTLSVAELPLLLNIDCFADVPPPLALTVNAECTAKIEKRLSKVAGRPLLGVTWRAGTKTKQALFKQIDAHKLGRALRAWPGEVVMLQRNPDAREVRAFEAGLERSAVDCSDFNDDLDSMLALLAQLQHYVGVSNTNMHLYAGLAKPATVLVPHPPEWRWGLEGDQSPWFPSFSVYRQGVNGSWEAALARVSDNLSDETGVMTT